VSLEHLGEEEARRELLDLILRVSFRRERVILKSGRESDFYLDLRQTLMLPRGVLLAGHLMWAKLRGGSPVDAVGGMAVGAVPLVAAILAAVGQDPGAVRSAPAGPPSPVGFFVRKEAKAHGLGRRIEGGFRAGQTVALVEDTCTTGGSTLAALDAVEAARGKVGRVLCLVDRGEGASAAFAERGLQLEPLFTRTDLPV